MLNYSVAELRVFRVLPFRTSYVWGMVYASCLMALNNIVAFGMITLFNFLWDETDNGLLDELLNMKGAYTFAMISTFLSSVYANSFYLQSYIKARDEKQALEMALMKEKEIALQSQLNLLKLQINPHFMFNNFNNLLELIAADPAPCIVAKGRKGGSNIAAAVCNALMYQLTRG